MAYPVGSDLAAALVARGILTEVPADTTELSDIMSGVCTEFERDSGWVPYLYPGGETTRTFDPPNTPVLFMNVGLIDITTFTVSDDAQTADVDYWLEPAGSGPYTRIRFAYQPSGNPQTIEINGQWGYTTVLSADVERALIGKAIVRYLETQSNGVIGLGGSPTRLKQDDVEKEFGENGTLVKKLELAYNRCVMRYLAPWKVLAT
jgi:hypothetical protein